MLKSSRSFPYDLGGNMIETIKAILFGIIEGITENITNNLISVSSIHIKFSTNFIVIVYEINLFIIGDANKVGRIADATAQAYDVAIHKIK